MERFVLLRRPASMSLPRGGVFIGEERRIKAARERLPVFDPVFDAWNGSSSPARLNTDGAMVEFLMVRGAVDLGLPLEGTIGLDLGDTSRIEGDEDAVLDEAEAEIALVCGSTGPLLNGLNSHEGVSFDANVLREGECDFLVLAAVN
jgi:hypothetical protein